MSSDSEASYTSDSEVSDTASHLADEDYEEDGFVVKSDDDEAEDGADAAAAGGGSSGDGGGDGDEDDESAAVREIKANYASLTTTERRARRAQKTPAELYDEYSAELEETRAALKDLGAEIKSTKDAAVLRSLREEEEDLRDHAALMQEKIKDLEEAERTVFGDVDRWEADLKKARAQWPAVEAAFRSAEAALGRARSADKKRIAELELEKAAKKEKTLRTRIANLEKKIGNARAEREMLERSDSSGDEGSSGSSGRSGDDSSDSDYTPSSSMSESDDDYDSEEDD